MPGAFLHPFAKPTRERFPSITHGKGSLVWDHTGHEMIDAMASLWYCQIGHGRGDMADAIAGQARQIEAYSCFDPFTNGPADRLAEKIVSLTTTPDSRVFFTNSGSEAIDSAMKLARLTHVLNGHPERTLIISRVRGYHGTNYGGTSAQGLPLNKEGYGPLLEDVIQVDSDDVEALDWRGEHISTLLHGIIKAGTHSIVWDGTASGGGIVMNGVYYLKVTLTDTLDVNERLFSGTALCTAFDLEETYRQGGIGTTDATGFYSTRDLDFFPSLQGHEWQDAIAPDGDYLGVFSFSDTVTIRVSTPSPPAGGWIYHMSLDIVLVDGPNYMEFHFVPDDSTGVFMVGR